ncbi:MAG: gamma-glutamylcyclotransferase [bacterium]|nr:gamma-glutamylcyclotransferase [bacterium]
MSAIIAYGSLMSATELERHGIRNTNPCPVIVSSFRRSFSQEPSRRKGVGNKRGVLTVSPDDQASMNAILVSGISRSALADLDERECGYDRVRVNKESLQPFDGQCDIDQREVFIYVGNPHKLNSKLEPNISYLNLCVEAAGEWGELFRETFRATTFASGVPLVEYAEGAFVV